MNFNLFYFSHLRETKEALTRKFQKMKAELRGKIENK